MPYNFSLKNKLLFYGNYFTSKIFRLWFEMKKSKFKIFFYEILYSLCKFINPSFMLPSPFKIDFVETKFGKFKIRSETADLAYVSPAYERKDIDYLVRLIQKLAQNNKKILFLDIGADLGTYSITVGNRFKYYRGLKIFAFEPAKSSYDLLIENIKLNDLEEKIEAFNFAVYSEDGKEIEFIFNHSTPGSSRLTSSSHVVPDRASATDIVLTRTLDSIIADKIENYDAIILKMDVEGLESEVLKGGNKILNSGKEIYLLVEDFINTKIINYLEDIDAEFISKLTSYNSWWKL